MNATGSAPSVPAATAAPAALVRATELEVGFGRQAILPPVTFEAAAGELWMVVGANGSGKTTLLRTLLGLIRPIRGTVERSSRVGYVPQRAILDPRVPGRVQDIITSGIDAGWSFLRPGLAHFRREAVERALELGRCAELRNRQYRDLSEGQKQRVLIARALVCSPELLVLDEPTSAMDRASEAHVLELLADVRSTLGLGVLVVSHNLPGISRVATHAVVLDPRLSTVPAGPVAALEEDPLTHGVFCTHPPFSAGSSAVSPTVGQGPEAGSSAVSPTFGQGPGPSSAVSPTFGQGPEAGSSAVSPTFGQGPEAAAGGA